MKLISLSEAVFELATLPLKSEQFSLAKHANYSFQKPFFRDMTSMRRGNGCLQRLHCYNAMDACFGVFEALRKLNNIPKVRKLPV